MGEARALDHTHATPVFAAFGVIGGYGGSATYTHHRRIAPAQAQRALVGMSAHRSGRLGGNKARRLCAEQVDGGECGVTVNRLQYGAG